jgi:hypothetical protein
MCEQASGALEKRGAGDHKRAIRKVTRIVTTCVVIARKL